MSYCDTGLRANLISGYGIKPVHYVIMFTPAPKRDYKLMSVDVSVSPSAGHDDRLNQSGKPPA